MKEMMKHTLLYIAVSGMTLLTSCLLYTSEAADD